MLRPRGRAIAAAPPSREGALATEIPAQIGDLNNAWLTEALHDGGYLDASNSVEEHSWTRVGEGEGFLGELARVELQYAAEADGAPDRVIAKFPTVIPENRGLGMLFGSYLNEIRFYRELAPKLSIATAECYYGAEDDEPLSSRMVTKVLGWLPNAVTLRLIDRLTATAGKSSRRFGLLIEDLGHLRVGDQAAGCGVEDATAALKSLAWLHATFWESPDLERDWIQRPDDQPDLVHALFQRAWPVYEQRFGGLISSEVRARTEWVTEHGVALLERMGQPPLTLIHGDYRLDNLMFATSADDPDVTMIDWQAVNASNPMVDVAYFLLPNVRTEVAAEHQDTLLRAYYDTLVEGGVTDYSWERCQSDYVLAQLWLIHRGVLLIGTLDLSHERAVELVDHAVERSLPNVVSIDLDAVEL